MKLIAGLGNVGDKYLFTRHNAGFMVVDKLAYEKNVEFRQESKLKCFLAKFKINGEYIILIKPTTFMNLSGEAVSAVMNYYKIEKKDVLIIYDDISLDLGKIRFRANGSDGGHNGIKSIIKHLGTKDFDRIKVGIGPQPPIPSEAFVLQNFSKEQMDDLKQTIKRTVEAVEFYLENGIAQAQNKFN